MKTVHSIWVKMFWVSSCLFPLSPLILNQCLPKIQPCFRRRTTCFHLNCYLMVFGSFLSFWAVITSFLLEQKLLRAMLLVTSLWEINSTPCCSKSGTKALSPSKITNKTELEDTPRTKSVDIITTCFQFVGQTEEDIEHSMNTEHSYGCIYPMALFSSHAEVLLTSPHKWKAVSVFHMAKVSISKDLDYLQHNLSLHFNREETLLFS